jgi:hypothetical protein
MFVQKTRGKNVGEIDPWSMKDIGHWVIANREPKSFDLFLQIHSIVKLTCETFRYELHLLFQNNNNNAK